MKAPVLAIALAAVWFTCPLTLLSQTPPASPEPPKAQTAPPPASGPGSEVPIAAESVTHGSVTIGGIAIPYTATAGTIVLKDKNEKPTADIFFVAYARSDVKDGSTRPVMFFYNGGPGSSSVWLHMGAFGPQRVVTADHSATPPAPYGLVNNDYSLLDATDMVFIDAPGTGFSRIIDKDHGGTGDPKDFFSVDGDGHAFAQFITLYLTQFHRWNSPKYLLGESYGTTRSAVLARYLETEDDVDLNGVVLLSQILNFDISNDDDPEHNPGDDLPYILSLPTYAATAWYHHKLANPPADLHTLLARAEQFAENEYTHALQQGDTLSPEVKLQIARQLTQLAGLSPEYWVKANLRVGGGEFEHELLGATGLTGRLDTRFAGAALDPMGEEAAYDPQSSAISSAYVADFNRYIRETLNYKPEIPYLPEADFGQPWVMRHAPPGAGEPLDQTANVMPDLAMAMKVNPHLAVQLEAGYYDLATPYFAAVFAMQHLGLPPEIAKNISYNFYQSGHMVYVNLPSLQLLHDNVAKLIRATSNPATSN